MTNYDVFNGDADGICALQQLRLACPTESRLITGVKRDVQLLRHVFPERGDALTVLDISLDSNRTDLIRILDAEATVTYFDHHFSGAVPEHDSFRPHLHDSRNVCTSLLVDEFLEGKYRLWTIVGAAGDNLEAVARELGSSLLSATELDRLCELGRLLNYNSYGRTVDELHFAPNLLYETMMPYSNPLDFISNDPAFPRLREGYASDMARAAGLKPYREASGCAVYVLPDAAWARRVAGVMANQLTRRWPEKSVAVLVPNSSTCYMVSLRVSEKSSLRADEFCRRFDSGGGRATAGGINHLPRQGLDDFVQVLWKSFA